jgi:serine phosphatase RsbU (regulator of sigma subunit)
MPQRIASDAFARAAFRSERLRVLGVLLIVACFIFVDLLQIIIHHNLKDTIRLTIFALFWIFCGLSELPIFFLISRAKRRVAAGGLVRPIPISYLVANTMIECSLPTLATLAFTDKTFYIGPYLALVASHNLVYCLLITLSTLRLSPALSLLSGGVCSVEYFLVYLFTLHVAPENRNRSLLPPEVYILYSFLLLMCGVVAAGVARQIRQHVIAALQEAETRRKLDRMEFDLNVARSIQMGLLPKVPPSIPGYDVAGFSLPADQTGGDYYDWVELPGNRAIFTIADATGHGIGPALLAVACRAYFRALVTHANPLESITNQIDALIARDVSDGRFITAAIALLEPDLHRLSLYSAGHGPLFLYHAAGDQVTAFDSDQPPLGFGSCATDPDARAHIIPLAPGDSLILVTDGIFESRNAANDLLGTDRLTEIIRQNHTQSAQALIQTLHQSAIAFANGAPQSDDITAVIIKRL